MGKNTPFTEHEAVLLFDAYLSAVEGKRSRQEAIKFCSEELRNMAKNMGIHVDDSYRSIAGISLQMKRMDSAFQGDGEFDSTKLFRRIVSLYRENRKSYDELLEEAKTQVTTRARSEMRYHTKLKNEEPEQKKVDFTEIGDLSNTRPCEVRYFGDFKIVKSWKDAYTSVCTLLIEDYPDYFARFRQDSLAGLGKKWITDKNGADLLTMPVQISHDYYIEANRSATALMRNLKWILDECLIDYENVIIAYTNKAKGIGEVPLLKDTKPLPIIQNDNIKMFYRWMRDSRGIAGNTCKGYVSSLETVENIAEKNGLNLSDAFSENTIVSELTTDALFDLNDFIRKNNSTHGRLKAAVNRYKEFLAETRIGFISDGSYPYEDNARFKDIKQNGKLLNEIEDLALEAELQGVTEEIIAEKLGVTIGQIRETLDNSSSIMSIGGRLVHKDSFVDFEIGASQLEAILEKLMNRNNGYVSDTQLYDCANQEMPMFLYDNDLLDVRKVYDLAEYLFGKADYDGKRFVFSKKKHISRGDENISTKLDIIKKFAKDEGGYFREEDLKSYLDRLGFNTTNLRLQMKLNKEANFFLYEHAVFLSAECMNIGDEWLNQIMENLKRLFDDVGDHVVLRGINASWYSLLPELPEGRPWTPLLLQSILKFYGKRVGARTISALEGQAIDTLHAMVVSFDSEITTFSDAVISILVDKNITKRSFEAEELRELLVKCGLISGNELIYNMRKALPSDHRYIWDIEGRYVKIVISER